MQEFLLFFQNKAGQGRGVGPVGKITHQYGIFFQICDSHANLLQYVRPGTADIVMFNFGWLPGADHSVFSTVDSSIPALL